MRRIIQFLPTVQFAPLGFTWRVSASLPVLSLMFVVAVQGASAVAQPLPAGDDVAPYLTEFTADSSDELETTFDVSHRLTPDCQSCPKPDCASAPCNCAACAKAKKPKADPVAAAYKGVYYANDFSYLNRGTSPTYIGDAFKQIKLGPCLTIDAAGEYRMRNHVENNIGLRQLNGLDNDFLLGRTRVYTNVDYGGIFRFYAEAIDATSAYEDLPPIVIEENRFDALNLFGEALLWDDGTGTMRARAGRQELLYGAQRLISPLDWANTRRTFDGVSFLWSSDNVDVTGFWSRPVPLAQHVMNDHNFDRADQSQEFAGIYSSVQATDDQLFDFYYLYYGEYDAPGNPIFPVDFQFNTFGARWMGAVGDLLCEIEGAYQFGEFGAASHSAGFYTCGFGHAFADLPGTPTFWAYFDWASGNENPAGGHHGDL